MRFSWSGSITPHLTLFGLCLVLSDAPADQSARDNGPAPSEDAFRICEGHNERDLIDIPGDNGQVFHGVCLEYRGRLALQPAHRHGTHPTKPQPSPKPAN
ncbi:hypothetical protein ABH908_000308 [Pseudomonas frederiksbergensis]